LDWLRRLTAYNVAPYFLVLEPIIMLDAKSLEVLQSLKTEIKASKTVFKGKIKGTGRNFGFVIADDGSEHFLPPDQMTKVFPGDEVTFTVTEQDDGKTRAEIETLVNSSFKEFKGVYFVRGKAQGVEPFSDAFNSWLFTPPKHTMEAKHNDIVVAKVTRHPWKTGKAQSEITQVIGSADNNRTWYSMSLSEHNIPERFNDEELMQAEQLLIEPPAATESYTDLTTIPFITIDSETTQDMDDALFAQSTSEGWELKVAIADASVFIQPGSVLDKAARARLTTTYLPGLVLPMLPETLSNNGISLVEGEVRPSIVFTLTVSAAGEVTDFDVELAKIINHGKLSYSNVALWLSEGQAPEQHNDNLKTLLEVTQALARWRKEHCNQMQDRADYRIRVNDNFDVTAIDKEEKNLARELVEEAMVATNYSVAHWLKNDTALFMAHKGFKADRESELKGLLRDYAASVSELDGYQLDSFIKILKNAADNPDFPLLMVLQKRFDRGYWSDKAEPHFGLGLPQYTNATSPIRKYTDLLIHRVIKAKLNNTEFKISSDTVKDINERNSGSRFVAQAIENRLRLQWLKAQETQTWAANIVHINANGLVVQLDDNGITGLVDLRKKKDEYSYDPLRMQLKFEEFNYQLGQPLTVQISKLEEDTLNFAIV
jgi:VacB/RNase II family 3'-5' exoribonuclease